MIHPPISEGSDWFVTKPLLEKSLEWQVGMTLFMSALALMAIIYAVREARRARRWHPVLILCGALLSVFYEPLGDLFAHVTYHEVKQISFHSAFGFRSPVWLLPTYIAFFGAPIIWLSTLIEKGIGLRSWMLLFFAAIPSVWIFEVPMIMMGYIAYYGDNQPFEILGYPVWMGFVNTSTMFVVGALVALISRVGFIDDKPFLLVMLVPLLVIGAHASASLPLASAINSTANMWQVNAMALVSMAVATLQVYVVGGLITSMPRPARNSGMENLNA